MCKTLKKRVSTPWHIYMVFRNAKIITVEPVLLLFMFARFLYTPLYEQYYFVRYGSEILDITSFPFPNGSFCLNSTEIDEYAGNGSYTVVETRSNHLVLYGQLANRIPSIVVTLLIGPLSDRFGRKPVIIAAGLGTSLQAAMAIVIVYFHMNPYYFIIANLFSGITGDFPGILAGAFSYVADVSSPKWRSLRIGIVEAVLALGGALGQFFAGYWLEKIDCDFIPPLWFNLACNIAVIIYTLILLPESLSREERRKNAAKNPKGYKAITQGVKIFVGKVYPLRSTCKLWLANVFISMAIFNVVGSLLITVYFLKALPFDFNALMIGVYQSVQSASRAISNTVILGVLVALKVPDALIALIGLGFSCSCNLLTGLSKKTYQVFAVSVFQGVEAMAWAAGRSIMSKLVASEDQGALFSVVASSEALASLLASIVWPIILPWTLRHNLSAGTTFIVMACFGLLGVPLLILLLLFRKEKHEVHSTKLRETADSEEDSLLGHNVIVSSDSSPDVTRTDVN